MVPDFFRSETGRIIVSIIVGLGLASMFRKVCKGNCIIVKGPNTSDIQKHYYKMDGECYKYTPYATPCDGSSNTKVPEQSTQAVTAEE
jgi:hypothetical protein